MSGASSDYKSNNAIVNWIEYRLPVFSFLDSQLNKYPTPKNLNYFWNFGSLAGIILVIMIVSGITLAMNYAAIESAAFDSVDRIMRDVNFGWLIRYIHMNGAHFFFFIVYIHIFRGLYYGSYKAPREILWMVGIFILLAMMATAFMGYVLPWGQMSFWGATVITNLFSAFPLIGESVVEWLWGGFVVGNPTLNRFFALHYLLPFVIVGLVFVHLWALHMHHSNNPTGVEIKDEKEDTIPFHPYYTIKDMFGLGVFLTFFAFIVFYAPNYLGHPDNYVPANSLVTPSLIVPEWYFLPFYAILRAFTDEYFIYAWFLQWFMSAKLAGVIAMFASILVLLALPWLDRSRVRSSKYRPIYKVAFWVFAIDCVILGWVGGQPAEGVYVTITQWATFYYFFHLIILVPVIGVLERPKPLPSSIAASVKGSHAPQAAE
ncbi:cytochrome b N-terminal domain-containing protein [Rhodospirillales bacterium]|nr:cytochrome b N-terminal domain-containing protein [Rhodospirillales bacterium]